ncbi:hypothetical protein BB560_000546 [Smittium megazygosporum]|uniref:Peptidase C14 caspase domain-containing protein n=1 Tax=Smittium megazygosporum TaxID=133381 RepID=A0A2T9ZK88_9FUNG|nr:hypothetical protein BB560_000546 [Smittium megazygosporum]
MYPGNRGSNKNRNDGNYPDNGYYNDQGQPNISFPGSGYQPMNDGSDRGLNQGHDGPSYPIPQGDNDQSYGHGNYGSSYGNNNYNDQASYNQNNYNDYSSRASNNQPGSGNNYQNHSPSPYPQGNNNYANSGNSGGNYYSEQYAFPDNSGSAFPEANMPYVPVIQSAINYNDMDFPEFDPNYAPPQQNNNYAQPTVGNLNDPNIPQNVKEQYFNVQLSNCQGRKRALLIGINYFNSKYTLKGCINDVHRMKKFLIDHFRFKESDMIILTDDQTNPKRIPTRENILKAMKWLVHDAKKNDSFFFHYSGHGNRVQDANGDELDGQDETICPVDFVKNGQIIDDDMNSIMVRPLPPGARLTAIFDCCHSATALDLPFTYSTKGKLKNDTAVSMAGSTLKGAGQSYMKGDVEGALQGIFKSLKTITSGEEYIEKSRKEKSSAGDVIMFSGCKDEQTSADAKEDLNFTGAMSWAFTNSLYENPRQTYIGLLRDVRKRLSGKYSQLPQLSSGRLMDMNTLFIM